MKVERILFLIYCDSHFFADSVLLKRLMTKTTFRKLQG